MVSPDEVEVSVDGATLPPIDLTNAPAGALAHPNPESGEPHVFTQADIDAPHGLTPAEVEEVRARRAAQGPFERRAWRRVAEYEMRLQKARKAGR